MRAFVRSALVLTVGACLALVSYVGIAAISVTWAGTHHDTTRVDAIVVMGAAQYDGVASPLLASRLEHALDLWKQKQFKNFFFLFNFDHSHIPDKNYLSKNTD